MCFGWIRCSYVQRAPASHTRIYLNNFGSKVCLWIYCMFGSAPEYTYTQTTTTANTVCRKQANSVQLNDTKTHTSELDAYTQSKAVHSMQCSTLEAFECEWKKTHTHTQREREKCMNFGSKIRVPKVVYRYSLPNRYEKAERYTTSVFRSGLSPYAHIQQASTSSVIGCALPPTRSRSIVLSA